MFGVEGSSVWGSRSVKSGSAPWLFQSKLERTFGVCAVVMLAAPASPPSNLLPASGFGLSRAGGGGGGGVAIAEAAPNVSANAHVRTARVDETSRVQWFIGKRPPCRWNAGARGVRLRFQRPNVRWPPRPGK